MGKLLIGDKLAKAQAERVKKAELAFQQGTLFIDQLDDDIAVIRSDRNTYTVTDSFCSCPDFYYRSVDGITCKHIHFLRLALAELKKEVA
tara:strand:- start:66 stop:335 length:270 start_codon:yes stop_codon:yes gene_type:complete